MSWENDDFEAVRSDPDPLRRGRRASSLMVIYQQRATELARLRKAAIQEAKQSGMTYTDIAEALGISKGRITQIKQSAANVERVFFGVGPVAVGIPYRYQTTDRERPLIAAEDAQTGNDAADLLAEQAFAVTRYQISPDTEAPPPGDGIVVCGPKTAPLGASLMEEDPRCQLLKVDGRWMFELPDKSTLGSPMDGDEALSTDIAYLARHKLSDRTIIHIAGVHAIGSMGAVHFLRHNLKDLFATVGDTSFSLAISSTFDDLSISDSQVAAGPFFWDRDD